MFDVGGELTQLVPLRLMEIKHLPLGSLHSTISTPKTV